MFGQSTNRWLVVTLVVLAWFAIVAFFVLNGLGPNGYIYDEVDALWTALGWFVAGGLVLGWLVRYCWFDVVPTRRRMTFHRAPQGDEAMPFHDEVRHDPDSEEQRYARGAWSIYDSDELDSRR